VPAYRILRTLLAALLPLAAAACTVVSGPQAERGSPSRGDGGPPASASVDDVVARSLKDVERFWTAHYPALSGGAAFKPVQGGYRPYTEADLPPPCGGEPAQYQPNAFYCPDGDFIAWDAQNLIPRLNAQFGPLLVGVVLAHEYGHAVQTRLGLADQPTVVLEQQADCFAGAWTADVLAGRSTAFRDVTPAQLDNTVAGLLMLRDEPGTSAANPQAHGNAFDRIRAVQDGVEKGADTCAAYRADTVPVTEVPFTRPEDAATGGDLPYPRAVSALADDAQGYWGRTFPRLANQQWQDLRVVPFDGDPPACPAPDASAGGSAFYCPSGDFVAFANRDFGQVLYRRIGDNAVGMLLGDLFARAAQDRRGASTTDRAGQLAVDCLAGSWTYDLLHRRGTTEGITLSPGDLDEAVAALLAFGRATEGTGTSAFGRIGAYRNGVLHGLTACT
jgi:predicted metalloprotease